MKKNFSIVMTAALVASAMTVPAFASTPASGWELRANGDWLYRYSDGTYATDEWKPSADGRMYYLGSNGIMLTDAMVETDGNYYYVDGTGARVINDWRYTEDYDGDLRWFWFGQSGKAQKAPSTGRVQTVEIRGRRYAFDADGRMLYGWVDSESAELADEYDEDAWKEADYYFNGPEDGSAAVGWKELDVVDDGEDQRYWFYFNASGKKVRNAKITINGVLYAFDTEDGHMLTGWTDADTSDGSQAITQGGEVKYIRNDGSAVKNSWVWAVPARDYLPEDYEDETYSWWYTNASGKICTDEIRLINGKRYALDLFGRMLTDFVTADEDKHNVSMFGWDENTTEYELFKAKLPIVYYCSNSLADGAVRTGYQNITLEDGVRQFWFNASGVGTTGYVSKIGKFTVSGMVLCADGESGKYAGVLVKTGTAGYELDPEISGMLYGRNIRTDGSCVLVNKSGTIQKNKTNLKDDDLYFCTDKDGRVTYVGYDKR